MPATSKNRPVWAGPHFLRCPQCGTCNAVELVRLDADLEPPPIGGPRRRSIARYTESQFQEFDSTGRCAKCQRELDARIGSPNLSVAPNIFTGNTPLVGVRTYIVTEPKCEEYDAWKKKSEAWRKSLPKR